MASQTYVDSVTLTAAAEFNKFDTAAYAALSGVAGTNTITATGPANLGLVATNPVLWLIPANTNTGATTLAITPSGGAALTAKNVFSGGAACLGGELIAGVPTPIVYDGTQYQILGIPQKSGTWTPALKFGGNSTGLTYTTQVGTYTKTGKNVTLSFNIVVNDNGSSSGAATITGLPFAAETVAGMQWSVGGYAEGLNAAGGLICGITSAGSSISLYYADATGAAGLTEVEIINGATVSCTINYRTAV